MRLAVFYFGLLISGVLASADNAAAEGALIATYTRGSDGLTHQSSDFSYSLGGQPVAPGLSIGTDRMVNGETEVFGSLNLGYEDITLSLGRPRTALDRLQRRDQVLPLTPFLLEEDLRFGMRVAGRANAYSYGASWHMSEGESDIVGVRGGYENADVSIYGGALSFGETTHYRLGTSLNYGAATAGVDVAHRDADKDQTAARIFVDYAVNETTTVGLIGLNDDFGTQSGQTSVGISAAYDIGKGFLKGGVAKAPDSDTLMGVSVGFRF